MSKQADMHVPQGVRLQKVLAQAGVGSRRACEEMILKGRVSVNGVTVRELGTRVDPENVVLHVDTIRVQLDKSLITVALNKPYGVVSTMSDPEGRETIAGLIAHRKENLHHVGRLDADSEGLLLLTNDGDLSHRLLHPKYQVPKTYLVEVKGKLTNKAAEALLAGIDLEDGRAKLDKFKLIDINEDSSLAEIEIHEGRNRIVRRMFAGAGFPVTRLVRTKIGPIRLGDLRVGKTRVLSEVEVGSLMKLVGM